MVLRGSQFDLSSCFVDERVEVKESHFHFLKWNDIFFDSLICLDILYKKVLCIVKIILV